MSEMAKQLAAIRDLIIGPPQIDPENNSFKQLRKNLASTLKDVVSKTKSEFGDPWGLVAMIRCQARSLRRRLSSQAHR